MSPLVSVIMPAYNAAKFIKDSIDSLLNQTYTEWELLVIDDGSVDNTKQILSAYNDPRIKIFTQSNMGVSTARNRGLEQMSGKYFTFLDADDLFPPRSLESRVILAEQNPRVDMVSGQVVFFSEQGIKKTWCPAYKGDPLQLFTRNDKNVFCNASLFIRRKPGISYRFKDGMTHVEDLHFFTSLAAQKTHIYDFVNEEVYQYRISGSSAMKNLKNLEKGYWTYYDSVKKLTNVLPSNTRYLKWRVIRIMFLSYLSAGKIGNAIGMVRNFFK